MNSICRCIVPFTLLLFSACAEAATVAIRAPVVCLGARSCGDDISLKHAKASYAKEGRGIMLDARHIPVDQGEWRPKSDKYKYLDLVGPLKPVPMTDRHICYDSTALGDYYFWAPVDEFVDGKTALDKLLYMARTGETSNGYVVVESDGSTLDEQHLALCTVSSVAGVSGPPQDCVTVAILIPQQTWVRGGADNVGSCEVAADFRPSGGIDITYNVRIGVDLRKIGASLLNTIQKTFGLSAEQETFSFSEGTPPYAISIKATGALRDSNILGGGWREAVDFDVFIRSTGEKQLYVRGTVHALVCRQALGNIINYSGLSSAQQGVYADAFDLGVGEAIKASGTRCKKEDARTIICE